jgi:hypothetical protein
MPTLQSIQYHVAAEYTGHTTVQMMWQHSWYKPDRVCTTDVAG